MTKLDVWAAELADEPGGLSRVLRAVADYGADLDCVLARRATDQKGKGVVFMTPLTGHEQLDNADQVGLHRATNLATLKIEGTDHPGMGADLAKLIADAGVNLHGLTAAVISRRFVCYASFDSIADLEKARSAIAAHFAKARRSWREILPHRTQRKEKVPA